MYFLNSGKKFSFTFLTLIIVLFLIVSIKLGTINSFAHSNINQDESEKIQLAGSPVFDDFNAWVSSNIKNDYKVTGEQLILGERLAVERQTALRQLIRLDPQAALEKTISAEAFRQLPSSVAERTETPISTRGDFLVYVVDEMDHASGQLTGSHTEREVRIGANRYKAAVYGRRIEMTTKLDIPLVGVIVGDTIVVDESPVRVLDSTARRPADSSLSNIDAVAAEVGEKVVEFADESQLAEFVREQIEWESSIGPSRAEAAKAEGTQTTASSWTEGAKTVLFIRVDFSDRPGEPLDQGNVRLTSTAALNLINNSVNQFYVTNSYNKTSVLGTVTPVVRLPHPQTHYTSNPYAIMDDARTAARAAGFETNNFNLDIVAFSYTSSIGWAGLASVGGKGNLLNGAFVLTVAAHELGHNYGLRHANLWRTTDGTPIGAGSNVEYGDCFDFMGACFNQSANSHFNTRYKRLLDWLTDANVQTVTADGTYRIYAQDTPTQNGIHTLKIKKDATKNYWVEFRQTLAGNSLNGALLRWDYASQNYRETQLLDMTPSSSTTSDAPLMIGQSFYDSAAQIRITVVGKGGTMPESLDVRVEFNGGGTTPTPTPNATPTPQTTPTPVPTPTPTPIPCTYLLLSTSASSEASGGTGAAELNAPSGCRWTTVSNAAWITIVSGANGNGYGTFTFLVQPNTGNARTGTITAGGQTFTVIQAAGGVCACGIGTAAFDFDGDGKTDLSIFRPSVGEWWYQKSSNGGNGAFQFGSGADKMVPADFTGDGKIDIAFWRTSTGEWFILRSEDSSFYSFPFGASGDVPAPADYDGDGRANPAIYRPSNSTWYIMSSSGGTTIQQFGADGDIPAVADYDGDKKADIAVYRPSSGQWWLQRSSAGIVAYQFGSFTDLPVQGDYTGDGKADVAFFKPSTGEWFVMRSENNSYYLFPFGTTGDIPSPGDYDGDGKIDAAVFRPSNNNWFVQRSTAGTMIQTFGQTGDKPVPSAFIP